MSVKTAGIFSSSRGKVLAGLAFVLAAGGLLAYFNSPARTPLGEGWLLAEDEPVVRMAPEPPAPARLLPSGDAYTLLHDPGERALLVPDAAARRRLWTPRVWPGALLVGDDRGEGEAPAGRGEGDGPAGPDVQAASRTMPAANADTTTRTLPAMGARR